MIWTFIISVFAGNATKSYSHNDNNEEGIEITFEESKTKNGIQIEDVKGIEKTIINSTEVDEKEFVVR